MHTIRTHDARYNGPSPRSCHKMVLDPARKHIYVLGQYVTPTDAKTSPIPVDPDFFRYDIATNTWARISTNTLKDGGPDLVYDHQMCFDTREDRIYVFGGKTRPAPGAEYGFLKGMYTYNVASNQWRIHAYVSPSRVRSSAQERAVRAAVAYWPLDAAPSRAQEVVHLCRSTEPALPQVDRAAPLVFDGRRSDMHVYHMDTGVVEELSADYTKHGGPEPLFTQRSTIDPDLDEIYVYSGLCKDLTRDGDPETADTVNSCFWVYQIGVDRWRCVYQNARDEEDGVPDHNRTCPRPRFAHQLCYDSDRRVNYLFGGNANSTPHSRWRLDDLWQIKLVRYATADSAFLMRDRPTSDSILQRVHFLVLRLRYMAGAREAGRDGSTGSSRFASPARSLQPCSSCARTFSP